MFKKLLSVSLCLIICISMSTTALASNIATSDEINDKILELNAKYQNTKIELKTQPISKPQKTYDIKSFNIDSIDEMILDEAHAPVLKLESLDELESFLDKVEEFNKTVDEKTYYISAPVRASSTIYNGDHEFSWSAALWWHYLTLSWEVLVKKHIRVEYTYKWISDDKTEFVKGKKATSWIDGVTVARAWTQQGDATMNVLSENRPNDKLKTSVTGIYTLGVNVQVGGTTFPIGLSGTQTWVRYLLYN